jgi:crossover junction endodeoxyribonuclease RuvC
MVVLGLDPGLATTGYGVVHESADGTLTPLAYGTISTHASQPLPERLLAIEQQLDELLVEHQPDAVAVEELFFSRNVTTALIVGQARGVVILGAARHGLAVFEYKPMEIKQAISGYGSAAKSQVQEMVRMLLDLDEIPRPDDAADGLAVAICHLHSARLQAIIAGTP